MYLDQIYWSEMCAEREFSASFQLSHSHETSFCILAHYTKRPVILGDFCVPWVWTTRYTHITKHCVHLYVKPHVCFTARTTTWIFIEFDTGRHNTRSGWMDLQWWLLAPYKASIESNPVLQCELPPKKSVHNIKYRHHYGNLHQIKILQH